MSFEDFKNIYGRLSIANALYDEYEGALRGLQSAGVLEQMLENDTGISMPRFREDSARTRLAEKVAEYYARFKGQMTDYTKTNLDNILKDFNKQNIIRAASLGIQHNLKDLRDVSDTNKELTSYLFAYSLIERLKEEEEDEESMQGQSGGRHKRKKRLTREQRSMYTDMVLPLIIKERLRAAGKVPEKDLDFYAESIAYVAALSDRNYVANAKNEGQELLGKRIESIGGINDYIRKNLKEDTDYLLFARSLGEAYELSEAYKKASESEAH